MSPIPLLRSYRCNFTAEMQRELAGGWATRSHCHTFCELGVITKGSCDWLIYSTDDGGKELVVRYQVNAGEAILIPAHQWHSEEVGEKSALVEWTGFVAPREALEGLKFGAVLKLKDWGAEVLGVTRRIRMENYHRTAEYEQCVSLLLAELLLLLRRVSAGTTAPGRYLTSEDQLEAARRFLTQYTGPESSIEQVARYHGYSSAHFEALFTKRHGVTPKRYQQQQRLKSVLASLREGIRSPKELALQHGFSDVAYFCRWFRTQTGTTPSRWSES